MNYERSWPDVTPREIRHGAVEPVRHKHLDAYLDELEHRFNNRKNEYIFRDTLTKLVTAAKLPYAELTKAA
jgi:hypothetical protein